MNGALPGSLILRGGGFQQLAHDRDRSGEGTNSCQRAAQQHAVRGRADPARRSLFLDLIMKLRRCRCLDDVLVVTADPSVERQARWFGNKVLLQKGDEGHSEAATAGAHAAMAEGADRVAMLPSTARCSTRRSSTPTSDAPLGPC